MKKQASVIIGLAVAVTAQQALGAASEVRGTWVTTTGFPTGSVSSPSVTQTNFKKLHDIGLNSIYMDAWRAGYTYFSSPTLQAIVGTDHAPETGTRDLLQETLIQSHRNGMAQLSWFQYGFATFFGNPGGTANPLTNYAQAHGWLLQDSSGAYTNSTNSFSWMNPMRPEVQQFITGIVTDAVKKYDVDGIQFDDRIAWPVQFGYDNYTKSQYLAETGKNAPTSSTDPDYANFNSWRSGKLTTFTQNLQTAIKAINPNVIFSVAPEVYPASYSDYLVNWPAWQSAGMLDEFVPQVYRRNATDFDSSWDGVGSQTNGGQVQFMGPRKSDFAAGMAIDGSGWTAPFDPNGIKQEITQVRGTTGVAGHVLWYSNGVLNTYPNELTAFYDVANQGTAARPDQPAGWRPTSTVATTAGASKWQLNIPTANQYSIIYQTNTGTWAIFDTRNLPVGNTTIPITIGGITAVEAIVDHRPASLFATTSWNIDASGSASAGSSWSFGIVPPATADTTLHFGYVITAGRTVSLDTNLKAGTLLFDNSSSYTINGSSSITLDVTTSSAAVNVTAGSHTINAPLSLLDNTTFSVPSGAIFTASNLAAPNVAITKTGSGQLVLNRARSSSLLINQGSVKMLADGGSNGVSKVASLTLSSNTRLDLNNNKLIVSSATPAGSWNGSAYTGLQGLLQSGYHNGDWQGASGILTSQSDVTSPIATTTLGIARVSEALGIGAGQTATWAGQIVTGSDSLIMYTYGGDADLSGFIDALDYGQIDGAINLTPQPLGYYNGDFNFDGLIDALDYGIIDGNINTQGAAFFAGGSNTLDPSLLAIPEPTSLMFVGGACAALRRRKRNSL